MYTITIFLFLSMSLVLGSLISFVVFLAYPVIIAKRIINEEAVLEKDLDGYTEYKKEGKIQNHSISVVSTDFTVESRNYRIYCPVCK